MYQTATYFIKDQVPNASIPELLQLYRQALEEQSVSLVQMVGDSITFSNNTFRFVLNRHANKFSGFNSGTIKIEDDGTAYVVSLEADNTRTLKMAGIISGIVTLASFGDSGIGWHQMVLGLIVFCVLYAIGSGLDAVFFPVYFTSLRNEIERRLQTTGAGISTKEIQMEREGGGA